MSLSPKQALSVAQNLLTALVRDTRDMSKTVSILEWLVTNRAADAWSEADEAVFTAKLSHITELCERYRTGESILTITRKVAVERAERAKRSDLVRCEIAEVDNVYDPTRRWVLRWQTATMPAPSFSYYATEADAEREAELLQRGRR